MATEFSREFFADNRIVKASLRCAHKLREKDLDRIKSEIKKLYDATEVILNITVDESLIYSDEGKSGTSLDVLTRA